MTYGSLFSGIGGFDLGFHWAGFECLYQVEIDPYCRRILAKHWPNTPRHDDVRTFSARDFPTPDVLVGGFPCQDISTGCEPHRKRQGLDGPKSGLWSEYRRIVGECRPRYVVVENIGRGLERWVPQVLEAFAALGYDADWETLPVTFVGGHHRRMRTFVVAHSHRQRLEGQHGQGEPQGQPGGGGHGGSGRVFRPLDQPDWPAEPRVGRVVDGVSGRVERLTGLGNAVSPPLAHYVARCVLLHSQENP